MVFICSFCESNKNDAGWFVHTGLCDTCKKVRDLSKIYSMDILLKSLETIYIRDEEPINHRTEVIAESIELRSSKNKKSLNHPKTQP
jgi:hypothetical protein